MEDLVSVILKERGWVVLGVFLILGLVILLFFRDVNTNIELQQYLSKKIIDFEMKDILFLFWLVWLFFKN